MKVTGPLGELTLALPSVVSAEVKDGRVLLKADLKARKDASALYGMARARVNNMVHGVSQGFEKKLQIVGMGFRVEETTGDEQNGHVLRLSLGRSHPVMFTVPKGLKVVVDPKKTLITLSGRDKDQLGQTAAELRGLRPPEPYKGTGIRYQNEYVRKKAGKSAAGAAGTTGAGAKK